MEFTNTNSRFGFDNLSLNSGKKFDGIPVYADVRDFTSKFDEDDENLIEMAYRVIELLKTMYNIVDKCSGTHVQFQGDREFAVFVMDKNNVILKNVIIAGLRMIDAIDKTTIFSLGIGAVEGKLHATTIGIRNNKDNILLGKAVNEANYAEDELAEKKELVISDDIFEKLNVIDKKLASIFKMKARGYYYTTLGYSHYRNIVEKEELIQSTKNKLYNGAWS